MKIYLAGPDVFRANAKEHLAALKKIGEEYGHEILTPFDTELDDKTPFPHLVIGLNNFRLIDSCDIIVANLTPFRGPNIDDGTAVEIGYGYKAGKIICGYTSDILTLYARTIQTQIDSASLNNFEYPIIEDFNLRFNLMIHTAIVDSHGILEDTFENVLKGLNDIQIRMMTTKIR